MPRDISDEYEELLRSRRRRFLAAVGGGGLAALAGCAGGGGGDGGGGGGGGGDSDGGGSDSDSGGSDSGGSDSGGDSSGGDGDTVEYMGRELDPSVTLQFMQPGDADEEWEFQKSIFQDFTDETGIEVKATRLGTEDYKVQAGNYLGTSNAPDMYYMWPGPGRAGEFVASGYAQELRSSGLVREEVWSRLEPASVGFQFGDANPLKWRQGNQYYGLGVSTYAFPIWFNEVVLNEAGINPDDLRHRTDVTYEEFEGYLEQVTTETDHAGIAMGNRRGGKLAYWGSPLMFKSVGVERHLNTVFQQSDSKFTDDEYVEALTTLKEWWDKEYIIPDTLALSEHEGNGIFFQNQAAFISDGWWASGEYDQYADPDELAGMGEEGGWDFMWMPYFPDKFEEGQNWRSGSPASGGWMVSATAEQRGQTTEATALFEHNLKDEYTAERVSQFGDVPAHTNAEQFEFANDSVAQISVGLGNADQVIPKTDLLFLPEASDTYYQRGQGLFSGDSVEQVLQALQTSTEEAVSKYEA
jgi:ABC-type glycerol-3-phosphate transport system substrate-binding protein